MTAEVARAQPIHIIESGPAAGVVAAHHLARRINVNNAITMDIGGTTAKASLIENGETTYSPEYEVGGGIITIEPPGARRGLSPARPHPRYRGDRRGRRQHRLDRQGRRSTGRPQERGCESRSRMLWTRGRGTHPDG